MNPTDQVLSVSEEVFVFPMSFAQQRLWFLDQWAPHSAVYNIALGLRLTGVLSVSALKRAIEAMVGRHEILRTTFVAEEGKPVQVVALEADVPIDVADLSLVSQSQDELVVHLAITEASRVFDLARGPLFRILILFLGEDEHVVLLTMHHIISDRWSLGVMMSEIGAQYELALQGNVDDIPPLPMQYADYAVWQREWLRGAAREEQLGYWKTQLRGDLPILELPLDLPRPPVQTFNGCTRKFEIPPELSRELAIQSRRLNVTPFMTQLACFAALLHRHSRQTDILVGTPVANRTRTELEALIGFFVNTLVLRMDLSGGPSLRQLLERVRETTLDAYAHQDFPFEMLVEVLQPERDLSRSPLFQVMFVFQNAAGKEGGFGNIKIDPLLLETRTAKFDLTLTIAEADGQFLGEFEYNTDLLQAETIERFIAHYLILLRAIIAEIDRSLEHISLLTEAELHQLLIEWNQTQVAYPQDLCMHQLLEQQAQTIPQKIAVIGNGQKLSYGELNGRANQLARHLRKLGVRPETRVALCMHRTPELVIVLLAILKAGGVYVPLDPAYPDERLRYMLADSRAELLICDSKRSEYLSEQHIKVCCLEEHGEIIARESAGDPVIWASARNLAYLIYTSGSTGQPKGVMLEHRSVTAFLHWVRNAFTPEELSGVLASTSACFDLFAFELWGPLSWGGTVVLVENALALRESGIQQSVRLINTVPSAMKELLHSNSLPSGLVTVNLAGEPLPEALVTELHEAGVSRVLNLYGPSEDTTYSTWCEVLPGRKPPIGRPISNTRVYLLDEFMQPVPVGVTGELYLAGFGLARGYWRRPELTADRFVPDPFAARGGERLYRTGDLALYRNDGSIDFLGRSDDQVKLRGFRIELGEIEEVLRRHLGVRQATVLVERSAGEPRLVACVVPAQTPAPDEEELHAFLRKSLPEFMLPTAYLLLERLPLTPSGKIDRRNLHVFSAARSSLAVPYVAPQTPLQEVLVGIWQEVLGVTSVGIHDNFFLRGGHSLLAMQVIGHLNSVFPLELPPQAIFKAPTVASLANWMIEHETSPDQVVAIAELRQAIDAMSPEDVQQLLEEDS